MYIDYIGFNKFCPKDPFLLPDIDRLVNNFLGYQLLSFMDAYFGYNQIPMFSLEKEKIALITD